MSWSGDEPKERSLAGQNPLLASFKMPSQTHKRRSLRSSDNEEAVLDEIHDFSDTLRTTLVPQFDELSERLAQSLSSFNDQLHQLRALHQQTREMVDGFEAQVNATEHDMTGQLQHLRGWEGPGERVRDMQARVEVLRESLVKSKERLLTLDRVIRAVEKREMQRELKLKLIGRTAIAGVILLLSVLWVVIKRKSDKSIPNTT